MNTKTMIATAVASMALAGCAGIHADAGASGSSQASALAAGGMSYCKRDSLVAEGGKLTCNWARSTREACESAAMSTIATASVASGPDRSTMCADGTPLVRVARK